MEARVTFSIIIPTRNRPGLLRRALDSTAAQRGAEFEVIVVDDGSDPAMLAKTAAVVQTAGPRVRLHRLPQVGGGHGPAYARNVGVELATQDYIGFLDDDDEWTDPDYLARVARVLVARVLAARPGPIDLHYANQAAIQHGAPIGRAIWIEDLKPLVEASLQPGPAGAYEIGVAQLVRSGGFCHLNTTVVRRAFFQQIGAFDAGLRYESDRDFALRSIDAAGAILYSPVVVARHYVPDQAQRANVSTTSSELQRRLHQLRLLDKAILFSKHAEMRSYGKRHKAYTLKRIAAALADQGDVELALYYGREAALVGFGAKWSGYLAWLCGRGLAQRMRRAISG